MAPSEVYRLASLVEDLAETTFEANRARAKAEREILAKLDALTESRVEPAASSKALITKLLPWIVAIGSAIAEGMHRMNGG